MKFAIHTAMLLLLFGITTSTFARQEGKGEPKEEAKPATQAKPAPRQEARQAKPATQAKPAPRQVARQTKPATQAKPAQRQVARQTKPATQAKPAQRQQAQKAKPAQQQRTQQARVKSGNPGNGAHGRISDAHYSASFGSGHSFHVNQGEFNNHRFEYGGYSFGFIDPWPVGWLYTDAVYVEYVDGGYYMFDPFHPGIRLSINIL